MFILSLLNYCIPFILPFFATHNMVPSMKKTTLEYIFIKLEDNFKSKRITKDVSKIQKSLLIEGENFYQNFKSIADKSKTWNEFKRRCLEKILEGSIESLSRFTEQMRNETISEILTRIEKLLEETDLDFNIVKTNLMLKVKKETNEILTLCRNKGDIASFKKRNELMEEELKRRKHNHKEMKKRLQKKDVKTIKKDKRLEVNQIQIIEKQNAGKKIYIEEEAVEVLLDSGLDVNLITTEVVERNSLAIFNVDEVKVTNIFGSEYKLNKKTLFI